MISCFPVPRQSILQLESYCEKGHDRGEGHLRVMDNDTLTFPNCDLMSADVCWSDQHHLLVCFLPPLNTKTEVIGSIFH